MVVDDELGILESDQRPAFTLRLQSSHRCPRCGCTRAFSGNASKKSKSY